MRMKHEVISKRRATELGKKRPTNVTLPSELVQEARALNVNLSKACAAGLAAAVEQAEEARWKADNADWIAAHRRWVEANELPLEKYRLF